MVTVPTILVILLGTQGLISGMLDIITECQKDGSGSFILGCINTSIGALLLGAPWAGALITPFVFGTLLLLQGATFVVWAFRVGVKF
jgi:uncharacterized membrane protein HdeD (DUF308 family)